MEDLKVLCTVIRNLEFQKLASLLLVIDNVDIILFY